MSKPTEPTDQSPFGVFDETADQALSLQLAQLLTDLGAVKEAIEASPNRVLRERCARTLHEQAKPLSDWAVGLRRVAFYEMNMRGASYSQIGSRVGLGKGTVGDAVRKEAVRIELLEQ